MCICSKMSSKSSVLFFPGVRVIAPPLFIRVRVPINLNFLSYTKLACSSFVSFVKMKTSGLVYLIAQYRENIIKSSKPHTVCD